MASLPTIDVLPPMSPKVRDVLYGVLAWAAFIVTITTTVYGLLPHEGIPHWLVVVNSVVVAAWTLGGFKAKANVPTT